ncbi:hypothetical protein PtA15_11A101 [Puccinia triticina]|uniref:G-protein coupled receptors family 1 profile domain-containing protein n=1 Tax=Puccinia triticina TaxID=208348 RepID=A0ABY7CYI8_9BASI|nr:uncharacterized protein PtA15_11A101 [Puccinia triticina]WAQ89413.1 hypothetical protein PtA15_11A101 [Puccinia triticina]
MAENIPAWTVRPTEWAVLRDQIASTSKPTLSDSIRQSSFILIALCSVSIFVHFCSLLLRLRNKPSSSRRIIGSTILGYHQPDLTLILPIIFLINAILNVASLSSLLSDATRLQFKGYTMAIQQFNYSILLSAGILLTWALVCGLPPLRIGMYGAPRSRWGQPSIPSIQSKRTLKPSRLHSIVYSSLVIVFLVPLPCIILSMKAIEDINNLDAQLVLTVNRVLESGDQPAVNVVTDALQTISKLDQSSNFLFTHIRMLSAIHLFLTFVIIACCLWVSLTIIRQVVKEVHPQQPSTISRDDDQTDTLTDQNDCYKIHQLNHVTEPKPVLIANHNGNISGGQPSIEITNHDKDCDLESFGDKSTIQNKQSAYANRTDSFASENYLVPTVDGDHNQGPGSEAEQSKRSSNYVKKLKSILLLIGTCGSGFMVLNFCIMANSFKYPDNISIGDLLILKLEWSTWLWNGSISPLIGFANCFILLSKGRSVKQLPTWL